MSAKVIYIFVDKAGTIATIKAPCSKAAAEDYDFEAYGPKKVKGNVKARFDNLLKKGYNFANWHFIEQVPQNAVEAFEIEISKWRAGPTTQDLAKVYARDRVALRKVLSLFRRGKWLEAHVAAIKLDTIVRDVIPLKVWRLITEVRVRYRKAAGGC